MPSSQTYAVVAAARLFALLAIGAPALWYQDAGRPVRSSRTGRALDLPGPDDHPPRPGADPLAGGRGGCGRSDLRSRHARLHRHPRRPGRAPALCDGRSRAPHHDPHGRVAARVGGEPRTHVVAAHVEGARHRHLHLVDGRSRPQPGGQRDLRLRSSRQGPAHPLSARPASDQAAHRPLGDLSSGLDVEALGGELLGVTGDLLPTRALAIYVPRGDSPTPGGIEHRPRRGGRRRVREAGDRRLGARATGDRGPGFRLGGGGHGDRRGPPPRTGGGARWRPTLRGAEGARSPTSAVKFDTALLFSHFRDVATADERQRLAREMHDGVAQDIASLGYLVDALAARPANEQQAKQFAMLRDRVTKVVAEVRRSVMNLRTSIGENESLGAAISAVARHLSEASGIPIRVAARRAAHPAAAGGRGRALPDRAGGAEQRGQARPGDGDRRALPGLRTRRTDHDRRRRRRPSGRPHRLARTEDHARTGRPDRRPAVACATMQVADSPFQSCSRAPGGHCPTARTATEQGDPTMNDTISDPSSRRPRAHPRAGSARCSTSSPT